MNKFLLAVATVVFFISACTQDNKDIEKIYREIRPSTAEGIPTPPDKPILVIKGAIDVTNKEDELHLSLSDLEKLRVVQITVDDPFIKRQSTFEGVLMSDLLAYLKVDQNVQEIYLTALDDYSTTIPVTDFEEPVMLAFKENGQYIPSDKRGPLRIVYPYGYGLYEDEDFEALAYKWIWNLESIEVR